MQIKQIMGRGASCAAPLVFVVASSAQDKPIAYPAKGQSAAQQRQDDGECYVWSKQSTGVDPAVVASTPLQPAYSAAAMQQAQAERQQIMNTFCRTYGACMSGRGYSVG